MGILGSISPYNASLNHYSNPTMDQFCHCIYRHKPSSFCTVFHSTQDVTCIMTNFAEIDIRPLEAEIKDALLSKNFWTPFSNK